MLNFEKIKKAAYYIMAIGSIGAVLFMFAVIADAVSKSPTGFVAANYVIGDKGSCESSCGGKSATEGSSCYCDNSCAKYGDCCGDYQGYCAKK